MKTFTLKLYLKNTQMSTKEITGVVNSFQIVF